MATKKKSTAKKATTRKAAKKKVPVKKTATPAKKKAKAKKPAAAKKTSSVKKKTPAKKAPVKKSAAKKVASKGGPNGKSKVKLTAPRRGSKHLTAKELRSFQQLLLNLRDRVVDEISFLAGDNLSSVQLERTGEEGTDNFNREFALKLVSSDQDIIYEIDEALNRIRQGTYGICEISGEPIERERLKVMPHARHSVKVQSELEKGRARYRPFGPTISRG